MTGWSIVDDDDSSMRQCDSINEIGVWSSESKIDSLFSGTIKVSEVQNSNLT